MDRDICSFHIQSFKSSLMKGRCKTYIFASVWKIGLTLACAYMLVPKMTPMAVLFRYIRNDTAYGNLSLDYNYDNTYDDYYYTPYNDSSNAVFSADGNLNPDVNGNGYNYNNYNSIYGDYGQNYAYNGPSNLDYNQPSIPGNSADSGNGITGGTQPSLRFKRQAIDNDSDNETSKSPSKVEDNPNSVAKDKKDSNGLSEDKGSYESEVDYDIYQQYLDYINNNQDYILQDEAKPVDEDQATEVKDTSDEKTEEKEQLGSNDVESKDNKDDSDTSQAAKDQDTEKVNNNGKIKIIKKVRKKQIKTTDRPTNVESSYK